jgi:hypothetical protein
METAVSEKFDALVKALASNEELLEKVVASTSDEAAGILRDHGREIPTHEEMVALCDSEHPMTPFLELGFIDPLSLALTEAGWEG